MKTDSDPHGWRIAGLVVFLALALTAGAYAIHTRVYCDPRHPECRKIGPAAQEHAADSHAADTHAPAPAGAADHKEHGDSAASKAKSGGH
jgi:hypothetical protein